MGEIGIDIGGSGVKAVRLGPDGARRCARVGYTRPNLATLEQSIAQVARDVAAETGDVLGVCAPGVHKAGEVIYAANLPCLQGVRVSELTVRACGVAETRAVLTDAAATGLGSWRLAPVEGRLLTLAMGTGVGGALIEDGRSLTIDGSTIGHLGQMDVSIGEPEAPVGPDGGRGSLEAYVGWPALVGRFGENGAAAGIAAMGPDDPVVLALVRAIRVCHALYKPDVIRLVGGVGALFEPRLTLLLAQVADGLTGVARPSWRLETMDDPYIAALGAAQAADSVGGGDG
ncbi:MAG: ROK family protein [Phycisphaeraceae bacterium]|nr:MAG: ROK family protein [Phycisphaeraceae bacterium]